MQTANETNLPRISKTIKVTPDKLRMIAEKLELSARNGLPGDDITYELTPHVTLYFDPEVCAYSLVADIKRIEKQ